MSDTYNEIELTDEQLGSVHGAAHWHGFGHFGGFFGGGLNLGLGGGVLLGGGFVQQPTYVVEQQPAQVVEVAAPSQCGATATTLQATTGQTYTLVGGC